MTQISELDAITSLADDDLFLVRDGTDDRDKKIERGNVTLSAHPLATRAINTTAPLTGGGDLSADRTFAINAADGSNPGSMSAANFTKLAGIETGAEVTSQAKVVAALAGGTVTGNVTVTGTLKGRPGVIVEPGTSVSYGDSQNGQRIYFTSGSPISLALNPGTEGTEFTVFAEGGGVITVTFSGGTVRVAPTFGAKTKEQYSPLTISYRSATVVYVSGHLGAP